MRHLVALALSLVLSTPAMGQELLARYAAFIGEADLHNSLGQRLSEPWQVLRQDRANFHRFGIRQFADEWDPIFLSMDARAQFERLLQAGRIDPRARQMIMAGGAVVFIEVHGWRDRLHAVHVAVER
jgi:hypothetical protein